MSQYTHFDMKLRMRAPISVDDYSKEARRWLEANATHRVAGPRPWGEGSDDVAVFHNLSHDAEQNLLDELRVWHQAKCAAGFGAITWPLEYGGQGLSQEHSNEYSRLEDQFEIPQSHELFRVTLNLIAPTLREFGSQEQIGDLLRAFVRTDLLCCQLFSEPNSGSDLASLGLRAARQGDDWTLNGQKVWTSGAQFADWGELLARTDPDAPRHDGITAFLVPMDLRGITVRPIRQMSGGSSFNEVFFSDVRVSDKFRLGAVGQGWKVGLATLGFERSSAGTAKSVGGSWIQLRALGQHFGKTNDPGIRQSLANVYCHSRLQEFAAMRRSQVVAQPGEGSLRKLAWTRQMQRISDVASQILGPYLLADSGAWGTFAWTEHVLGAPGFRIAGGSDEIQRNIIAERLLGLPTEQNVPRNTPWNNIQR